MYLCLLDQLLKDETRWFTKGEERLTDVVKVVKKMRQWGILN